AAPRAVGRGAMGPRAGTPPARPPAPGHTTLAPLGPFVASMLSTVAALTAVKCSLARSATTVCGSAIFSRTPAGWTGRPVLPATGRPAVTVTSTGRDPDGKRHW